MAFSCIRIMYVLFGNLFTENLEDNGNQDVECVNLSLVHVRCAIDIAKQPHQEGSGRSNYRIILNAFLAAKANANANQTYQDTHSHTDISFFHARNKCIAQFSMRKRCIGYESAAIINVRVNLIKITSFAPHHLRSSNR